jgi:hypothetical protein
MFCRGDLVPEHWNNVCTEYNGRKSPFYQLVQYTLHAMAQKCYQQEGRQSAVFPAANFGTLISGTMYRLNIMEQNYIPWPGNVVGR